MTHKKCLLPIRMGRARLTWAGWLRSGELLWLVSLYLHSRAKRATGCAFPPSFTAFELFTPSILHSSSNHQLPFPRSRPVTIVCIDSLTVRPTMGAPLKERMQNQAIASQLNAPGWRTPLPRRLANSCAPSPCATILRQYLEAKIDDLKPGCAGDGDERVARAS